MKNNMDSKIQFRDIAKSSGVLRIKEVVDGKIVKEHTFKNLITNYGVQHIANALVAIALYNPMSQMAIGTGSGQTASDTTLDSEIDRQPLLKSQGIGGNANTAIYTATMPEGVGTGNITEAGIFNSATAGDMLCYTSFTAIDKQANVSLLMEWTITII